MGMGSYTAVCLLLLCVACSSGEAPGCPPMCSCPETPPCPPGAAAVLDSCGCGCTVCVRGLGSECDGFRPCDATQDLICDFQGDVSGQRGACKVRHEHQSCIHNGNEILHREEFEVDCESLCRCENGSIECAPLCPEPEKPLSYNCKELRLLTAPGECCAQWRCLEVSNGSEDQARPQDIYPALGDESTKIRARREDSEQDEEPLEDMHSCQPDTEWTPCSRTCGFGNSVRITYEKESCVPKAERRLCMIRPCKGQYPSANYTVLKANNVCSHVMRWSHPLHLRFRDCLSSRPLLPKFCGLCSDGRLCTPSLSGTRPVSFQCAQLNRKVTRQVMWVQRCRCGGKRRNKGKKGKNTVTPGGERRHELVGEE
ncbi:CCN family member 5-like isoform X2 [Eleutherodactylus coqui]|uniref:CCN family member 5-like isoform X2 n=1 Tax=Eleutherodactylus coqui TaxID=57060 RepID=UPI003462F4AE